MRMGCWTNSSRLWLLLCIGSFQCIFAWKLDRIPKIYGHHMLESKLVPSTVQVQDKIVAYHNFFRQNVRPRAANMLEMSWHEESAKRAQKWANACKFLKHDNATDRWTDHFGPCGQNIFISTHKVPWYFAIKSWFLEYRNFTYGSFTNNLGLVGHYTQMVWASSHKVGCGFTKCQTESQGKTFYNYVCNYCPTGNFMEILPWPYKKGKPCGLCPNSCHTQSGLCTNSCPVSDLWTDCMDMKREWNEQRLCHDKSNEGRERRKHCRATCFCKDKILGTFSYTRIERLRQARLGIGATEASLVYVTANSSTSNAIISYNDNTLGSIQ